MRVRYEISVVLFLMSSYDGYETTFVKVKLIFILSFIDLFTLLPRNVQSLLLTVLTIMG